MTPLSFHRYADIFPLLEAGELRDLAEDIRVNGLRKPIEIFERAVLDGRNRHNALVLLIESGAPRGPGWGAYEGQPLSADDLDIDASLPWFERYSVDQHGDPLDYVWSLNFRRRHLTASQAAACAAEFEGEKRKQGRPRLAPSTDDNPANLQVFPEEAPPAQPTTRAERAAQRGVSERTLADAEKVHERSPELHQAVKAGDVTADVAAAIVEKPPEQVKALLDALPRDDDGKLTPDAKREVRKVANELKQEKNEEKKQRREERERDTGQANLALAGDTETFGVIVADPEYDFEPYSRETGMDRHAANHYATSPPEVIAKRRELIDQIAAKNCVIGLWVADLRTGLQTLDAFGFEYRSYRVWVKDVVEYEFADSTRHALKLPNGKFLHVCGPAGTGFWGTSRSELMLIGVRGDVPCPPMGLQGENTWFAARPHVEGTNKNMHSAKPEDCFDWFDTHFPSLSKVELNARKERRGWKRWGLEAPKGEGWIGPVPAPKFAPIDDELGPEGLIDEPDDDGTLPPFPWVAGDDAAPEQPAAADSERPDQLGIPDFLRRPTDAEREAAANARAESDNEAQEAEQHA